jgi:transcription elongation factor GreA
MVNGKRLITKNGLEKLKAELRYRIGKIRNGIADSLNEAKNIGDLSENSAYTAAIEEFHHNEARIKELKDLINSLEIAPEKKEDEDVDIGDKVTLKDLVSFETVTYSIVGLGEGDPLKNKVSTDSIVGSAIIRRKVKEKIKIKLPKGEKEYEIIKIN